METWFYYFLVQVGVVGGNNDVLVQALTGAGKSLELFAAGTLVFLLCVLKFTAVVIIHINTVIASVPLASKEVYNTVSYFLEVF